MSSSVPLGHLIMAFVAAIVIGMALTLPLFKFDCRKFVRSELFIKILYWVPIFLVFLLVLYAGNTLRSAILLALLVLTLIEFVLVARRKKYDSALIVYYVFFALGLEYLYLIGSLYQIEFVSLLILLGFANAVSDVTAFFFGNYLGLHKLPDWLNGAKSWEGAAGQVVGAFIGTVIVKYFIVSTLPLWLFLPVGVGSAVGDLANSYVKRRVNIKDWSRFIPGHGGFIDRLSSLSGSAIALYYCLVITKVMF